MYKEKIELELGIFQNTKFGIDEIEVGDFELGIFSDTKFVIDVQNTDQGATLRLQERQKAGNPQWRVKLYKGVWNPEKLDVYVIYNAKNEKNAITFDDYDLTLTLEPINDYDLGQLWEIYDTDEGWKFRSFEVPSLVISTRNQEIKAGTEIIAFNDNGLQTQLWTPQNDRYPAEGLQEGKYAIRTKMNEQFCMYNENGPGPIKMDYALDFPDPYSHVIFDVAWWDDVKAYTLRLDHTTLVLSIENGGIVTQPFDKGNFLQYWSIQKAEDNTYIIESVNQPLLCIDVEGAWTAPLPGGNVIVWNKNGNANQQWIFEKPINSENVIKSNYHFDQWEEHSGAIGGVYFKIDKPDFLKYVERYKIEIEGFPIEYPWGKPIKHEVISDQVIKVSTGGAYGVDKQTPIKVWAIDKEGKYILILDRLVNSNATVSQTRGLPTSSFQANIGNKNNVKMQFNFYNSTCNIFVNDDNHDE
ncbi:RICIN domain-containing protein [Bacillus toyonensis]|uniref:RICIN domain-containing protein n=1 Tax=Bacillus toyonensis TaxID=155322 RepID=UPI00321AD107